MLNTLISKNTKNQFTSGHFQRFVPLPMILMIATCMTFSNCNNSAKKVEDARQDVIDATKELDKANREYLVDLENYRKEITTQIAANENRIAELKIKAAHEKKTYQAGYKKKIGELEQKNNDMKIRINDYKEEGKENWEKFKQEFSHDMDELGRALNDITVNNVK
jgi:hypothetical protein